MNVSAALERVRANPSVSWPVGVVLGWLVVSALLPKGAPLGVVLTGAVFGTATALLAMGHIPLLLQNPDRRQDRVIGQRGPIWHRRHEVSNRRFTPGP